MTLPTIKTHFLPHNRQEHDNDIRALVGRHMGNDFSNPTQWVVDAVHEAFRIGFSMGAEVGQARSWSDVSVDPKKATAAAEAVRIESPAMRSIGRRIAPRDDDIEG